jgi:hypothetical protein
MEFFAWFCRVNGMRQLQLLTSKLISKHKKTLIETLGATVEKGSELLNKVGSTVLSFSFEHTVNSATVTHHQPAIYSVWCYRMTTQKMNKQLSTITEK